MLCSIPVSVITATLWGSKAQTTAWLLNVPKAHFPLHNTPDDMVCLVIINIFVIVRISHRATVFTDPGNLLPEWKSRGHTSSEQSNDSVKVIDWSAKYFSFKEIVEPKIRSSFTLMSFQTCIAFFILCKISWKKFDNGDQWSYFGPHWVSLYGQKQFPFFKMTFCYSKVM